jgi:two-component system sensor histidine kinase RegB
MRVSLTERTAVSESDIRLGSDIAPALAAPWLVLLRYGLIVGLIVLILFVAFAAHVPLPLPWLAVPIAAMLPSNLLLPHLITGFGGRRALGLTLILDVLALTALLALTGGPANPLTLLYLVQITLSAVVLSRAWTWSLGILSILGFGFLFPFHIPLLALEGHHPALGFSVHLYGMWIAFVAAALMITFFVGEVSEALRLHERQSLELQIKLARHERLAAVGTLDAFGNGRHRRQGSRTLCAASYSRSEHGCGCGDHPGRSRSMRLDSSRHEYTRAGIRRRIAHKDQSWGALG